MFFVLETEQNLMKSEHNKVLKIYWYFQFNYMGPCSLGIACNTFSTYLIQSENVVVFIVWKLYLHDRLAGPYY